MGTGEIDEEEDKKSGSKEMGFIVFVFGSIILLIVCYSSLGLMDVQVLMRRILVLCLVVVDWHFYVQFGGILVIKRTRRFEKCMIWSMTKC